MTRSVNENAKGDIGEPVMATDGDNDVLIYSLANTPDRDDGDDARFKIDPDSGQISVVKGLNWEIPADERTPADTNETEISAAGDRVFVIRVRATDPSSASTDQDVLITVKDVNESPEFDEDDLKAQLTVYIDENRTANTTPTLVLRTGEAVATPASPPGAYTATDNDNTGRTADTIGYTVEGADEKFFDIGPTNGELAFTAELNGDGKGANFREEELVLDNHRGH